MLTEWGDWLVQSTFYEYFLYVFVNEFAFMTASHNQEHKYKTVLKGSIAGLSTESGFYFAPVLAMNTECGGACGHCWWRRNGVGRVLEQRALAFSDTRLFVNLHLVNSHSGPDQLRRSVNHGDSLLLRPMGAGEV